MLVDPNRARTLALVRSLGLAPVVLPELAEGHLDQAERVLAELPRRKIPVELAWAALGAGASAEAVDQLLVSLRCSNKEREDAVALLRDAPRVLGIGEVRLAEQKRLLLREDAPLVLELARALAVAGSGDLEPVRVARLRRAAFLAESGSTALGAAPLLRGGDLKDLGLKPGPRFKELLALAEDARLEGIARTREELVEWLRANRPDFFA